MPWNESKPSPTDIPNAELVSVITTNKIAFREGIEKHSFWTDSSGASIGLPRLSDGSFGPGSARAYYGTQSSVSTAESTTKAMSGRLQVTSDTSRLFGYLPTAILLGSKNAVVYQTGSQAAIQSNGRVLVQTGELNVVVPSSGVSIYAVTFPTAYTVAPRVQVTASASTTIISSAAAFTFPQLTLITASGFSIALGMHVSGGSEWTSHVLWRSHGTTSL
jgi:hypothetical protein